MNRIQYLLKIKESLDKGRILRLNISYMQKLVICSLVQSILYIPLMLGKKPIYACVFAFLVLSSLCIQIIIETIKAKENL